MREIITDDVGLVKVGGVVLPGISERLEVSGRVRIDQEAVGDSSGSSKQPQGYEDAEIRLQLRLTNDDRSSPYDKLRQLAAVFYAVDQAARPTIYRIVNRHVAAWGITEVIFQELRTWEDNQDDSLHAELSFVEFQPVLVRKEAMAPPAPHLPANGSAPKGVLEATWQPSSPVRTPNRPPSPARDDEPPPGGPR